MFDSAESIERPLQVRASFGQCFKAGAAFTCGAIVVATVASFLYLLIIARALPLLMLRML